MGWTERTSEVLIVGAGPTGLFLAGLLHKQNIPFRIIDKKETISEHSRALAVQARTLEAWANMGIVQRALRCGLEIGHADVKIDGKGVGAIDFSAIESPYPYVLSMPQVETERMLVDWLKMGGRHIEWSHELIGIKPIDQGVEVEILHQGKKLNQAYNWVVACDGAHSEVRKTLNLPFEGSGKPDYFALADVELDRYANTTRFSLNMSHLGGVIVIPLPEGRQRLIIDGDAPFPEEMTLTQWQALLSERGEGDLKIRKIFWQSQFSPHYRCLRNFYTQRILFAGDSAHVHSPAGGQGMNTGIQDVYNLAWKLALEISSRASDGLISSYDEERSLVAKNVLKFSQALTFLLRVKSPFLRSLRARLLRFMLTNPQRNLFLAKRISEISISYRASPIIREYVPWSFSRSIRLFKAGPKAGERAVDGPLVVPNQPEITTFFTFLAGYKHVCVLFLLDGPQIDDQTHDHIFRTAQGIDFKLSQEMRCAVVVQRESHPLLKEWKGEVIIDTDGKLHALYGAALPCAYIFRPDRHIGFRSHTIRQFLIRKYLSAVFDIS